MDCGSQSESSEGFICRHWRPSYWESKGFERNWGDAAVGNWPILEILRRAGAGRREGQRTEFVILAPMFLRRPLIMYSSDPSAWGSY